MVTKLDSLSGVTTRIMSSGLSTDLSSIEGKSFLSTSQITKNPQKSLYPTTAGQIINTLQSTPINALFLAILPLSFSAASSLIGSRLTTQLDNTSSFTNEKKVVATSGLISEVASGLK